MSDVAAGSAAEVVDADEPQPRRVSSTEVERLLDELSLRQIRLVRWFGYVAPDSDRVVEDVNLEAEPPRVRIGSSDISFWFEHRVSCRAPSGEMVAEIEVGVVAEFDIADDAILDLPLAAKFADDNGAFMAWPFIREAVQTMSVRLGLAPITLGILRRNLVGTRPRAVDRD